MIKAFLKDFRDGFESFGRNITVLVNSILLLIVYIIGVGASSLIMAITGKKQLKKISREKTYWEPADYKLREENYYRQF